MAIAFLDWHEYPRAEFAGGVVTIGNFDGVHRGHQALVAAARKLGRAVVVTFDPPPDSQTYRVRQILWQDAGYRWMDPATQQNYGPDDPRVTNAAFYLERADAPQRVVVGQDLATRQFTPPQEAHPTTWSMMVGG